VLRKEGKKEGHQKNLWALRNGKTKCEKQARSLAVTCDTCFEPRRAGIRRILGSQSPKLNSYHKKIQLEA